MYKFKKNMSVSEIENTAIKNYRLLNQCSFYLNKEGKIAKEVYSTIDDCCMWACSKEDIIKNIDNYINKPKKFVNFVSKYEKEVCETLLEFKKAWLS